MSYFRFIPIFLSFCLLASLSACGSKAMPGQFEQAQFGLSIQADTNDDILPANAARENKAWQALPQLSETDALRLRLLLRTRNTLDDIQSSGHLRELVESLLPALKAGYQQMLHPRVIQNEQDIPGAQALAFASHDGHKLKAAYLPAENASQQAVIVLHGYQLNKYMAWQKYAFLQQKYNVLFLDQRGHNGQSGDVTLGIKEQRDLEAPILWLKDHNNKAFAIFGESMGGATAIVAGARWASSTRQQLFPLRAVWNDAAYQDIEQAITAHSLHWLAKRAGLTPEFLKRWAANWIASTYSAWLSEDFGNHVEDLAAPRLHLPILVKHSAYGQVHSLEDQVTPVKSGQNLEAIAREHAQMPVYSWYAHGKHVESYQDPEYAPRVLHFLDSAFEQQSKPQAFILTATE